MSNNNKIILELKDLKKYFPITKGFLKKNVGYVKAVDGISVKLHKKETLGLVGESGCGKTTLVRSIIRAIEPTDGAVLFNHNGNMVDLAQLERKKLKKIRRNMQIIFQDPYSSLDPRMPIREIIGEPLLVNNIARGEKLDNRVRKLLGQVGLDPQYLKRFPHAFSGGQRQRISIARALSINPSLILADEPTSALDVSVQAQILNLLNELQDEFDLSYLFISHDLSVIRHICDRVAVMYVGKMVEIADTEDLFNFPAHPYTEALLSAIPKPDPDGQRKRIILEGEVPNPADLPTGCPFHPRCPYTEDICREKKPDLQQAGEGHRAACHLTDELQLKGITAREDNVI